MKKRSLLLAGILILSVALTGCGDTDAASTSTSMATLTAEPLPIVTSQETPSTESSVEKSSQAAEVEEVREGMYRSELTNEWIDESLQNQRPVAVMVDNETYALPHYGVNDADVVYEIMNSTANGRITRLMVVMKDWEKITQLGSIRSTRPTNFFLAAEWNAILCHDGGPFYIDEYVARKYTNNLSGGFARFSNGKATEFTEYITYNSYTNSSKGQTYAGLGTRIANAKYSTTYNEYYPGKHFQFSNKEYKLSDQYDTYPAKTISLPFPHNGSKLFYNEEKKTYDYYEYGNYHIDAATSEVTTFKNVILQSCSFAELDSNGYMIYNVIGSGSDGYYITNGEAIPITWSKSSETDITEFRNANTGEVIVLNTGKTYIAIVPSDSWNELSLK